MPYLNSVSISISVNSGSRLETEQINGMSHFLEHMMFKGTEKRNVLQLSQEIEAVGGNLNAYTSKEFTSYYCKVLSENLDLATDILTDIFLNSCFPEDEIEREKQVVYQEIYSIEDNPEELINELFYSRLWKGDPFGRPIIGTVENVRGFDRNKVIDFKRIAYVPCDTIVCAVGNLEHDRLVDIIGPEMERLQNGGPAKVVAKPKSTPGVDFYPKSSEQVHFCLGSEGPSQMDEDRHAAVIFNTIFGAGMSSRLFQEVREKKGLAYGIYSFFSAYSDTGTVAICGCTEPKKFEALLEVVGKETMRMLDSITEAEVQAAKTNLRGNMILGNESSSSVMNRLSRTEFYYGRYVSMDELIDEFETVDSDQIRNFASKLIKPENFAASVLGPVSSSMDLISYFKS